MIQSRCRDDVGRMTVCTWRAAAVRDGVPLRRPASRRCTTWIHHASCETDSASSDCCVCGAYKRTCLLTLSSPYTVLQAGGDGEQSQRWSDQWWWWWWWWCQLYTRLLHLFSLDSLYVMSCSQWWANPNRDWDINRDSNTFGDFWGICAMGFGIWE